MKNKLKSFQKRYLTIMAILSISCLVLFSLFIVYCVKYYHKPVTASTDDAITAPVPDTSALTEEAKAEVLSGIKQELSQGLSVSKLLRQMYPNDIVYYDNNKYVFTPIRDSLKKHNLQAANFRKNDKNEIEYVENSIVTSHKGIDVSRYQGNIAWDKVKNSGVEYAMIRVGYRAYGTGIITDDSSFKANIEGALSNNIPVGVYFFTQAITDKEATEEAEYVLNAIKDYDVTYPVVLDVEEILNDTYRQQELSRDELTSIIITFCERIKKESYTPMIYGNLKYMIGKLDLNRLESYEKWFAQYDDTLYYPYDVSMWQYTDSGSVDGVEGKVDLNISFKKWH